MSDSRHELQCRVRLFEMRFNLNAGGVEDPFKTFDSWTAQIAADNINDGFIKILQIDEEGEEHDAHGHGICFVSSTCNDKGRARNM